MEVRTVIVIARRITPWVLLMLMGMDPSAWALGQETFGNAPVSEQNYPEWRGVVEVVDDESRVYTRWVNGGELFYFRGNTEALNASLIRFAAIEADIHEVVLLPGPGKTESFDGKKKIVFDWMLEIVGGIMKSETSKEGASDVWPLAPRMTVYIGKNIELAKIEAPAGVVLVGPDELKGRYRKGLSAGGYGLRAQAASHLAGADPFDGESVKQIVALLDDGDSYVRSTAAFALGRMGRTAAGAVPVLKGKLTTADEHDGGFYQRAIDEIEQAPDRVGEAKAHQAVEEAIEVFLARRVKRQR